MSREKQRAKALDLILENVRRSADAEDRDMIEAGLALGFGLLGDIQRIADALEKQAEPANLVAGEVMTCAPLIDPDTLARGVAALEELASAARPV